MRRGTCTVPWAPGRTRPTGLHERSGTATAGRRPDNPTLDGRVGGRSDGRSCEPIPNAGPLLLTGRKSESIIGVDSRQLTGIDVLQDLRVSPVAVDRDHIVVPQAMPAASAAVVLGRSALLGLVLAPRSPRPRHDHTMSPKCRPPRRHPRWRIGGMAGVIPASRRVRWST